MEIHLVQMTHLSRYEDVYERLFNTNWESEAWRRTVLVQIGQNEADVQSCSNFRGTMSHSRKIWDRAVEARLNRSVSSRCLL